MTPSMVRSMAERVHADGDRELAADLCDVAKTLERLFELSDIVEKELVPILEMDNEANDPSTDFFIALNRVRVLLAGETKEGSNG